MRRKSDKEYILNRETLDYDVVEQPSEFRRWFKTILLYTVSSVSVFILSLFLLTDVFNLKTPLWRGMPASGIRSLIFFRGV